MYTYLLSLKKNCCIGCKAKIDNKEEQAEEKGLRARNPQGIVKECLALKGQTVDYSLLANNCEHFATKMRYGAAWSDQVSLIF